MIRQNSLTLKRAEYKTQEDFEMEIGKVAYMLMRNGYTLTMREADFQFFIIEYDYADGSFGGSHPYWLTPKEAESVEWED